MKNLSISEVHLALEREFAQQGRFGHPTSTHLTSRVCKKNLHMEIEASFILKRSRIMGITAANIRRDVKKKY